jgi:hypothetical protein
MISYDKSQTAWDFTQATDDEKEILMELAQDIWAKSMAYQIAQQMMATMPPPGAEYHDETERTKPSDKNPTNRSPRFDPLEGNEEGVVIAFPSKETH